MTRAPVKVQALRSGGVKKNTLYIGISQAVQLVLGFALNLVAVRSLGDENFGKYTFAWVLFYFVFLFDDFGINTYLTREISKNREAPETLFFNSLALKFAFVPVSAFFLVSYLRLFSFSHDKVAAVLLFGAFGVLYSFNNLFTSVYRAYERMEFEMAVTMVEKAIVTGLGIWVLARGKGLIVFSFMFVLASFASLLLNGILIKTHFIRGKARFKPRIMFGVLRAAFLFGLLGFMANIQERIGVLLLTAMKSDAEVGWFGAAYKLILVFNTLPTILFTATFPRIAKEMQNPNPGPGSVVSTLYTVGVKFLFFIAAPLIAGALFLGDQIVLLLFKQDFVESIIVLKILIFATGFEFINIYAAGFLLAANLQKKLVILQLSALVVNVLVNLILIPRYAHVGAAVATLVSYLLVLAVSLVLMHRRVCRLTEKRFFIQGTVASVAMLGFLAIGPRNLFLAVGSGALVYAGVLFLVGGIRIDDLRLLRQGKTRNGLSS